jgi:hypothetical protein
MTSSNPFADRLRQAAQEGYVNGTRRPARARTAPAESPFTPQVRRATDKQIQLIIDLLSERDLMSEDRPKFKARLIELATSAHAVERLDREAASNLITYLFGLPQFGTTHEPDAFTTVTAGHYAVLRDGEVCFVRVDRPTEGKWAGKVFVSLQHGDDYTRMGRQAGFTMLGYIVDQGVLECSVRYGREIGRCGVCHRTLTNPESREAGIGPKCRENSAW